MSMYVDRDGVKIAYDTTGRGDPAIVLVHGWACDRSYLSPQREHFATAHAVAALDLRGHGESDVPVPDSGVYDVEAHCADVLAVSAAAGFDRPVVIGHSLGGLVALACAARAGAVRAAVMIDPAPMLNQPIRAYLADAADKIEADAHRTWRTEFVNGMFLPTDTVRREEIVDGMTEQAPSIAAAALRAIPQFDAAAALGAVQVPLLLIGSATPTDAPSDLRGACPTITIGQTVGAGHFNQLEVPDQVNLMIERFLSINSL
jgi:pimeloyl-ACP methyl ester carboxylesterase